MVVLAQLCGRLVDESACTRWLLFRYSREDRHGCQTPSKTNHCLLGTVGNKKKSGDKSKLVQKLRKRCWDVVSLSKCK
eukprot:6044514-Amphidinium_carterae.2